MAGVPCRPNSRPIVVVLGNRIGLAGLALQHLAQLGSRQRTARVLCAGNLFRLEPALGTWPAAREIHVAHPDAACALYSAIWLVQLAAVAAVDISEDRNRGLILRGGEDHHAGLADTGQHILAHGLQTALGEVLFVNPDRRSRPGPCAGHRPRHRRFWNRSAPRKARLSAIGEICSGLTSGNGQRSACGPRRQNLLDRLREAAWAIEAAATNRRRSFGNTGQVHHSGTEAETGMFDTACICREVWQIAAREARPARDNAGQHGACRL